MSRLRMVEESVDVPVRRETRSYFWLFREVRVKVSSKRVASAILGGWFWCVCVCVEMKRFSV
jgi:hypothetical protein